MIKSPSRTLASLAMTLGMLLSASTAFADTPTFPISRFDIRGNSLLSDEQMDSLTRPFTGSVRSFADIQQALEALENAYRKLGYSSVAVALPEQEITGGVVTFNVVEARFGKISVTGAKSFDESNILSSLPHLLPGTMPHAILMSDDVSRANENPAKKVEVVLKISDVPGTVDAVVKVDDMVPTRFIASLDNTGMGSTTGNYRLGLAWQHANLFNRDHVLSLQYTTSPNHLSDVTLFNAGYHIPYYQLGDSLDLYGGYSNVDAGSFSGGGIDGFVGKGNVFGLRYNHPLKRVGEYEHKVSYGWDWKAFKNDCSGPACAFIGADVTATPLSLTYSGSWTRPRAQTQLSIGYSLNLPLGSNSGDENFAFAQHTQAGLLGAKRNFDALRIGVSQLNILQRNWQSRVSLNAQFTNDPLIQGEQLGLAGSNQVRGFNEREIARDVGYVLNLELFTPDLGNALSTSGIGLRGLVFADYGHGHFVKQVFEPDDGSETLASVGIGLRASYKKSTSFRLDLANVRNAAGLQEVGDWKAHLLFTTMF